MSSRDFAERSDFISVMKGAGSTQGVDPVGAIPILAPLSLHGDALGIIVLRGQLASVIERPSEIATGRFRSSRHAAIREIGRVRPRATR
jgi:hypothetical protein